jgi:hypothetical protein
MPKLTAENSTARRNTIDKFGNGKTPTGTSSEDIDKVITGEYLVGLYLPESLDFILSRRRAEKDTGSRLTEQDAQEDRVGHLCESERHE